MQKVFVIIVLLYFAASMGRANNALQAWENAVGTNAKAGVLLNSTNNVAVLTCSVTPNNINGVCSLEVNY